MVSSVAVYALRGGIGTGEQNGRRDLRTVLTAAENRTAGIPRILKRFTSPALLRPKVRSSARN
jgi:hypothetical protein